jgi:hypothetical protein
MKYPFILVFLILVGCGTDHGDLKVRDDALTAYVGGIDLDLSGLLLRNDDLTDATPTLSFDSEPTLGTLHAVGDNPFLRRWYYRPPVDGDGAGVDEFTYRLSVSGPGPTATVTISLLEPNGTPAAEDVVVAGPADQPIEISIAGSDPEDDVLMPEIITQPGHGRVEVDEYDLQPWDLRYVRSPNLDFVGQDTFQYRVHDGQTASEPATVTVELTEPRDRPNYHADG